MLNVDRDYIWHPYTELPAIYDNYLITKANGVHITLNGCSVIDGMSSWWAVIFGYNHNYLNQALTEQMNDFNHVMFGGITHSAAINLAKKLIQITPCGLDKIFFSDSGSVAVEVAMKIALQYHFNQGLTTKTKFVTPLGGYHGDTFGAMSVCDPVNGMHHIFSGVIAENIFTMKPTLSNSSEAISSLEHQISKQHENIAAFIVEPIVQGAGGMNFYTPQFLIKAKQLCEKYNILFIADEIATGFGRTGKLFAVEYADIVPDIMCIGKALTAGQLPMAATITHKKISDAVKTLMHGPTFMANPLACAVANASIDMLLNQNWQENIKRIEQVLSTELLDISHDKVKETRVLGGIGVIEFYDKLDVHKTQKILIEQGVWLRPFANLLYTMPSYITTDQQLKTITNAMKKIVVS